MFTYKQIQKTSRGIDCWWSIVIANRITFPLVYFFANYTNLKPYQINILSALTGYIAAFFFFQGTYKFLILGSILFEISSLLDATDGKLARLLKIQSPFGAILDKFSDKTVLILCLFTLSISQSSIHGNQNYLLLGIICFILAFTNNLIAYLFNVVNHTQLKLVKNKIWWIFSYTALESMKPIKIWGGKAYPIPHTIEWITILFVFSPIFNNVTWGFYIAYAIIINSSFYIILQIIRLLKKDSGI